MKNNAVVIGILALAIGGIGGFYGGVTYQQSKRMALFNGQPGISQNATRGGVDIRGGFRPVNGEIISRDKESITVKLQDGSSKIVLFSAKTQINKAEKVDMDALTKGETVSVFGSENKDGSVTAQNIQLNPVLRMIEPR